MSTQAQPPKTSDIAARPALPEREPLPRISIWLWFIPSALFIVAVTIGSVLVNTAAIPPLWAAIALGLAVVASGLAAVSEYHPPCRSRRPAFELSVASLLLLAAGVVHGSSQGSLEAPALLAGMPVAWLSFIFGRSGATLAACCVVALSVSPYVVGVPTPLTAVEQWDIALPVIALIGGAGVAFQAGRLLSNAQMRIFVRTAALKREITTTRAIVEAVDAAVAVFVPGEIPYLNSKTVDMCHRAGVTTGPIRPRSPSVGPHVHDADQFTPTPPLSQALQRAERGEVFSDLVQWWGTGSDQRAMVCTSTRIPSPDGDNLGTVFTAWDATDVLDSMRVRNEFLGTVGHELRTPLTAIMGYLELHDERSGEHPTSGDTQSSRYIDAARRQVSALSDRIEDLLATARPRKIATTVVDVVPLTRAIVSAHHEHAQRCDLRLHLKCPEELIAAVNAAAYKQILDNLLDNALKFTLQGSVTVTLKPCTTDQPGQPGNAAAAPSDSRPRTASTTDGGLIIEVEDTGFGMNEREALRVFDPFYRTEAATRQVLPGLGVGLAVTKQLVAAHHGSITIQSQPDHGSRFRVTLPSSTT